MSRHYCNGFIRIRSCAKKLYLSELPTVSVVVPFFNEHWSTLLRTCYSVLNRSPDDLIVEIILVDDASTKDFLKAKLDRYVAAHLPKVKIVRLGERSGLIIARLAGAKVASGDVLIFLDSHTEANTNWLPPLLGTEISAPHWRREALICHCRFQIQSLRTTESAFARSSMSLHTIRSSIEHKTKERAVHSIGNSITRDCRCCPTIWRIRRGRSAAP